MAEARGGAAGAGAARAGREGSRAKSRLEVDDGDEINRKPAKHVVAHDLGFLCHPQAALAWRILVRHDEVHEEVNNEEDVDEPIQSEPHWPAILNKADLAREGQVGGEGGANVCNRGPGPMMRRASMGVKTAVKARQMKEVRSQYGIQLLVRGLMMPRSCSLGEVILCKAKRNVRS